MDKWDNLSKRARIQIFFQNLVGGGGGDGPEAHFISVILLLACKLIYIKFSGGGGGKDSDFSTPLVSHMLNHNGCQLGTVGVLVWPIDYVHGDL